jgi:4-amino-4-deoxy-L-arabinose transferase-like glycosyltransferase
VELASEAPDPKACGRRGIRVWTAAVVLVGSLAILAFFRDFGITWDEPVQARYGEGVLAYFRSGGEDTRDADFLNMRYYGPAFELVAAIAYAGWPEAKYEVRHLLLGGVALLGVVGLIPLARRLGGGWTPIFAPVALVGLPRFTGHAFNNSKDIPFAVCFVWAVVGLLAFAAEPRRWRRVVACGVALGAALAVRPGGMPLLLLIVACAAAPLLREPGGVRAVAPRALAALALAWVVMVLPWPWAHESPLAGPLRAMAVALSFPKTFPVLFEGQVRPSDLLPRHYLAKYVLITTPPALLALAALGLGRALRRQLREPLGEPSRTLGVLEAWLLGPLLLPFVLRPNVYDGMRHVLFTLPALALFAAFGAQGALARARSGWPRRAAAPLLLALCAQALPSLVRLHPYQMTYFNAFVGGVAGAQGRYETDYWLASYKEAMEWIDRRVAEAPGGRLRILVAIDRFAWDCAAHYLAPGVEMTAASDVGRGGPVPEPFDYYVATTRYGAHRSYAASPIVHSVGRDGAVFTVIRARAGAGGG